MSRKKTSSIETLINSELWNEKPAWWLKVYQYLQYKTSKEDEIYPMGTAFFTYQEIYTKCYLQREKVQIKTIDNVIRWLKKRKKLTTQKTKLGLVITFSEAKISGNVFIWPNETENGTKTKLKRHSNDTETKLKRFKPPAIQEVIQLFKNKVLPGNEYALKERFAFFLGWIGHDINVKIFADSVFISCNCTLF